MMAQSERDCVIAVGRQHAKGSRWHASGANQAATRASAVRDSVATKPKIRAGLPSSEARDLDRDGGRGGRRPSRSVSPSSFFNHQRTGLEGPKPIRRHLRRQRNLRRLPSGRSQAVERLAAQGRDAARHRQDRARQFQRCRFRLFRRALPLLPQGRQISGRDRWRRRQARRVRGEVHLRHRSAAAIPRRVSRRTPAGAVARLGQPAAGQGRPALVSPLAQRGDQARRYPALDQAEPELEFHVRGVPLDRPAQELRRQGRSLRHDRGRKSAWAARPVMDRARATPPGRAISRAGGRSASAKIPSKGLLVRFDERRDVTWPIDAQTGTARRSAAPATLRKEVETCGLCHARRAGFHEDWIPGQWLSQTHVVEALARNTYHADGQIRDVEEPYNYTPFKQGKMFAAGVTCSDCHEPHSAKLRAPAKASACNVMPPDKYRRREASPPRRRRSAADLHLVPHAGAHLHGRRYQARSRLSRSAARSLGQAGDAERLQRLPPRQAGAMGRRRGRAMVRSRSQGLSDLWAGIPCSAHGPGRCRRASWRPGRGQQCAGRGARQRARRTRLPRLADEYRDGARRARRSRSDGTDRRARHAGERARRPDLAAGLAAACPIPCAACASGRPPCSLPFRPQASRRRTARASIRRPPNSSPRNAPMPSGRKPAPRSQISSRSADRAAMPRRNTRPR